jgi:hypothetical protein
MAGYRILYSLSLAVYTFGALAFSALALSYWRERRLRFAPLPVFTIVCAAAFLLSFAREWNASPVLRLIQDVATGLIPALMLHVVYGPGGLTHASQAASFAARGRWCLSPGLLALFYVVGPSASLAAESSDRFEAAPAIVLAAAAIVGVFAPRAALRLLFALLALCAVLDLALSIPVLALVPDYLVLAFFAVVLYYDERLRFFDVLVKRGAFFAAGLLALSLFETWRTALLLMPFWLAAPWIYGRMSRWIERVWLHRKYSAAEAERRFLRDVQGASSEADLEARAARAASEIFRTRAIIGERIELQPRPDGIPFLSDDLRLVESLSRTLAILRDNVRFRDLTTRAELKALRAQINPHFLFNALNAIAGLIRTQPELAEETVERLADVFRYTLRKSQTEWVRLEEEMEFVSAYLAIEHARFGDRLRVETAISESARAMQVPAMSIQPLVENAIKHGTSAVERDGCVRVSAAISEGVLRVEVVDNGPGFRSAVGEGHGLRNVGDRLAGYYGAAARLSWENLPEGARVWIEIPAVTEAARCGS